MRKTGKTLLIGCPFTLIFISVSVLFMGCDQGGDDEAWSIDHIAAFGSAPVFSPDGSMVAFGGDDGETLGLWIYTLGAGIELLYEGAVNYDYAWSPSSEQIAFSEPGGMERRLLLLGIEGGLVILSDNGRNPTFSPSGEEIAFQDGIGAGIYKVPFLGGEAEQLSSYGEFPQWSPDGSYIALRTGSGINYEFHRYSVENGTVTQWGAGGPNFDWSPDGTALVYDAYELVGAGYYFNIKKITVSASSGSILWQGGVEPKWSPVGNKILLRSLSGFSGSSLILIPASGGAGEQITSNGYSPAFSPSGNKIAFTRSESGIWLANKN